MLHVPTLETDHLLIRRFTLDDLPAVSEVLDGALAEAAGSEPLLVAKRQAWLEWNVRSYDQLAQLDQPPYGERAIVLRETGALIGACGYVPCLTAFGQLADLRIADQPVEDGLTSPEVGLFYAIAPEHRQRGYASEAAQALIDHAFAVMQLRRIVATTDYENAGSIGVMRKLGMTILTNPFPSPPWLQVVGTLTNPAAVR